jgi:peptidoglycan hydrolase-like protein with peptidoglycan-binding domain
MRRSYSVLAASLVGLAGLAGVTHVVGSGAGDDGTSGPIAIAAGSEVEPAGDVVDPTAPPVDPDCTVSTPLQAGMTGPQVMCLEAHLIAAGALVGGPADEVFDEVTEAAVEAFQASHSLVVDGMVGPQTAKRLGAWAGPDVLPPDFAACPESGRAALVDRSGQRAWLCEDGAATVDMPITSAVSQPEPGTYEVYAKDLDASSSFGGEYSTMTHFVAFTYGKFQGARIAFHSVPKDVNGDYVQSLDSVGTQELFGDSSGCIRVLPADAELIWSWLEIGDSVTVIT